MTTHWTELNGNRFTQKLHSFMLLETGYLQLKKVGDRRNNNMDVVTVRYDKSYITAYILHHLQPLGLDAETTAKLVKEALTRLDGNKPSDEQPEVQS